MIEHEPPYEDRPPSSDPASLEMVMKSLIDLNTKKIAENPEEEARQANSEVQALQFEADLIGEELEHLRGDKNEPKEAAIAERELYVDTLNALHEKRDERDQDKP